MDIEVSRAAGVERRARLHAALADHVRLRIVDRLSGGDASPTELQQLLGIPSNLLAHHLGVLEAAGILLRRRSEADRRRTYLHLVPGVLAVLSPVAREQAPRVVFVCTANTARSQLAAALWNQVSSVPATSAGTHPADRVAPGAVAAAQRHQLPLRQTRPRALEDVIDHEDYLVTVCDNAYEELQRGHQDLPRTVHWSVPDPVPAGTEIAFDAVYDDLATRVGQLAPRLAPN